MPRPARLHLAGGTYYLLQMSARHQILFRHERDFAEFEWRLAKSLKRTQTHALAYAWLPETIHLAVRCGEVSVSRFMQGLTSSFGRYRHRDTDESGHLFRQRFQSILIDPNAYLPELARFIHDLPVRAGLAPTPSDYAHSSAAVFLQTRTVPWLNVELVLTALVARGLSAAAARSYLVNKPTPHEIALFDSDHHADSRVLGDDAFRAQLPYEYRPHARLASVQQLIDQVVISLNVKRAELYSRSRTRRTALARSVIAWHARERGLASLTEVAQLLGRDVSTLSKAIIRHREQRPELFVLDAFRHLVPLG